MKQYKVQITNKALADMEEIYNYIAIQLQAPENAMGQYNRIAEAIEGLNVFPERTKLMEPEPEQMMGLRQFRNKFQFRTSHVIKNFLSNL